MTRATKHHWRSILFCLALVCAATSGSSAQLVYFGTQGSAAGQGIVAARFDERNGQLTALGTMAEVARPTWLVVDPRKPLLYSVSEVGGDGKSGGSVLSFAIDRDTGALRELNRESSGGGGPAHLALDSRSRTLFVAHYGTGQVSSLPLLEDGKLGAVVSDLTHVGTGPSPRQARPHAHSVLIDPSGKFLLAADLGADRIFIYRIDAARHALAPSDPASAPVEAGAGPRHLAIHPNGRFVFLITELTSQVIAYRWDGRTGSLTPVQTVSAATPDFPGVRSSAEISLSRDGRYLYVSNRNEASIVVYAVNGRSAMLQELQRIDSGGTVPWSFAIAPGGNWLLVANQASNNIAVFQRNPKTGRLTATPQSLAVQKPVNVTFVAGR